MWLLNAFLSPVYRVLALVGVVLAAIGAVYAKGRTDAAEKMKVKSYKETQDAIEKATAARRDAATRGLRDDDGFKRDE